MGKHKESVKDMSCEVPLQYQNQPDDWSWPQLISMLFLSIIAVTLYCIGSVVKFVLIPVIYIIKKRRL